MDLFTYLMVKNNQNTQKDLFSYLLGKSSGQSGTYTTYTGTTLNILNTLKGKIKNIELKPSEITQGGTPTPDAPIEVNTVTGNNTITIQGKNLFDYNNTTVEEAFGNLPTKERNGYKGGWAYRIVLQKTIQPGTYTISFKVKDVDNSPTANMRLIDENNQEIEGTIINCNSTNSSTITTTKTISKLLIDNGLNAVTTLIYDIQIEYGNQATKYNAYQSQNYSINLGSIEYAKIGSAEDKIYRDDNGNWYFEEHIAKKILNGTENWVYSTLSNDTITSAFVRGLGGKNLSTYMCNKFPYLTVISAYTTVEYCGTNGDAMRLGVFNSRLNTADLQGLTSWLSENNIKVYFELATPTTTQITDTTLIAQLENLYQNAQSYNGTTNVTQTNTKLPFVLNMDVLIKQ